jgi:hypothetical protein
MYPIDDNVIYNLIHKWHQHRRESYLLGLRSSTDRDEQAKKRHKNAHTKEVSYQSVI